jgi:long-chain acyl-CoA synthetase
MKGRFNLADDLRTSAARFRDRPALIFQGEFITFEALNAQVDRVASGLRKLGLRKGDRVAFAIGNRPAFAAVHYGCLRAGAVSVPLNGSLKAHDLRLYLESVKPRAIVADESAVGEMMSAGPHSAPVFVVGGHPTARPFDEVLNDSPPPDPQTEPDDPAMLAFTSGTSGRPKAAVLSHLNISSNLDQLEEVPGALAESGDVVLGVLPLHHIYPLTVSLALPIRRGAVVALQERFHPVSTMDSVAADRVTVIPGVPPMYVAWLEMGDPRRFDTSGVRFAVSGASGLAIEVIEAFKDSFGVEIWEGYGLAEAAPVVATTRMGEMRPGSVGLPLPRVELRIVDSDGNEVMPGDPGEIWIRGPNVFSGYWNDPKSTKEAFAGEWLRTGDVGYRDQDGYLWLVDRLSEVINVSGFSVFPKEVEEALLTHPAVLDAAVVAVPDERQGERVKAFVTLLGDQRLGEDQLIVYCTTRLGRFKVPSEIEVVERLPRTPAGKMVKRRLQKPED